MWRGREILLARPILYVIVDIHYAFFDNAVRGKRAVSRTSSGKFLRVESCYPESFGFLRLCIKPSFNLFVTLTQDIWIVVMEVK